MDTHAFYMGQEFEVEGFLGAHVEEGEDGTPGVTFRTYAPAAAGIVVVTDAWEEPMQKILNGSFWEAHIAGAKPGDAYEYRIYHHDGTYTDHCDPYGLAMEVRPDHRSLVCDYDELGAHEWHDASWMATRTSCQDGPLNIYEMHAGSWRRHEDESWYTYEELARELPGYLEESGYNYVEFMPLSEHPMDESWGYQNTGFFSPTSRYGTPEQLMELVDALHARGIGTIMDFVPVHFAVDDYGLGNYDGTALYEYPCNDVSVSEWGSYNFIHSRGETRSLLQSAANLWLKTYHFDGLRMDAISRIIYWQGDERRGVNGNAVDFVRTMNRGLKERNPGCILCAEDSTSFAGTTRPADQGGLGFDYKWDMGWMHDTLEYFQTAPEYRTRDYHKLTFSMMYFHDERYLLPLSHDEVVHGKATVAQKMSGDYEDKFPQARALYMYMMAHPGKKLNFMGSEIAQLREWDEKREQDWFLRRYPLHDGFYHYICELNHLYLEHPALWAADYEDEGFEWADCRQEAACVYAILRQGGGEQLLCVLNLSDTPQSWEWELPKGVGSMELLLSTDWRRFGGATADGTAGLSLGKAGAAGRARATFELAPFSGLLLALV